MNLKVSEGQLGGAIDVLIGMDIIGRGDFSVTCVGGKTCMSFRFPSKATIDYVAEGKAANLAAAHGVKGHAKAKQGKSFGKHKR
jgi:hypothetical protein